MASILTWALPDIMRTWLRTGQMPQRMALMRCVLCVLCLMASVSVVYAQEQADEGAAPQEASAQALRKARQRVEQGTERAAVASEDAPINAAKQALQDSLGVAFGANVAELKIAGVEVICDAPVCKDRIEELRSITGLVVGEPFAFEKAQRASERLYKTGLFESIEVIPSMTPDGIALSLKLGGAIRISRIKFEGLAPPPFRDDFRRLLIYREGQPFRALKEEENRVSWRLHADNFTAFVGAQLTPREISKSDNSTLTGRLSREQGRVQAQLQSFEELLSRDGFFDASVSLVAERDEKDPYLVTLTVVLEKGKAQKICDLGIRGLRQMTYTEARALLFKDRPLWTRYAGFIRPVYTERMLRAGQEALIQAYREQGFYRARVLNKRINEQGGACVQVLLDVSEGPKWRTIFRGNKIFSSEDLRASLPFKNTGYVDQKAIRDAEEQLEQLHATRGYPFARVECEEERKDRFDRVIQCFVEEGPRKEISEVTFAAFDAQASLEGGVNNERLAPVALQELMRTKPFGLFETGGFLQLEELMADLARVEERYHEEGYLWAQVVGFKVDSVGENGLRVTVLIKEGKQARVESAALIKLKEVVNTFKASTTSSQLESKLSMLKGPLSMVQVRADNSRLTQHYAMLGYPMADVETQCHVGQGDASSPDTWGECSIPSVASSCVVRDIQKLKENFCVWEGDVTTGLQGSCARVLTFQDSCLFKQEEMNAHYAIKHTINPGPFVTVDAIWISGNHKTKESLLRAEIDIKEGERLDVKQLLEGQAGMRSLGLFDSVSVEAIGLDDAAQQLEESETILMVSVEEGKYRYFDLSVGFQGRDLLDSTRRKLLLTSELEYNNRNWRGMAQRLQPRLLAAIDTLQTGRLGAGLGSGNVDAQGASQRFDYLVGTELVYNHPRFLRASLGVEKLLLTVAPYYLIDLIGVTLNNLLREEVGSRAEIRKDLSRVLDRLFLTFGLQGKVIATRTQESLAFTDTGERLFSPRRTVGKFYLDTTLDRRDSPLNPKKGYFLKFSPQLVSGDALGSDPGDALTDAYFKLTLGGSGYLSLGQNITLAQSLRYGQIIPIFGRRRPTPEDERYILGGVSSLRGVPEAGINTQVLSYRDVLRGGEFVLNSNSELRYPLLGSYGIFGATFFDVGVLADCFDDENTSEPVRCYKDAFPKADPLSKVRASAGIGVRYLVGEQVPLLLDYAMLLNRRPGERAGYLHFNVGYTF